MIISKAPYRISFFGGGSDFSYWFNKKGNVSQILSCAINRYCFISIKNIDNLFSHKYRVSYSKIEEVSHINQINHPPTRAVLEYMKLKNIEVLYTGELPSRSGVGSSSAFIISLLNACYAYKKTKFFKKKISKDSIYIEQNILKENVGWQDQIAIAYGGLNYIKISNNKFNVRPIKKTNRISLFEDNIFLLYSGKQRFSSKIQKHHVLGIEKNINNIELKKISNYTKKGIEILTNDKLVLDDFGYLLNESWLIKKELHPHVSNFDSDSIYSMAIDNGALGGKLCGAGGGGFFIFYVPKKNHGKFKKFANNFFYTKIKIDYQGPQIIY